MCWCVSMIVDDDVKMSMMVMMLLCMMMMMIMMWLCMMLMMITMLLCYDVEDNIDVVDVIGE